MHRNKFKITSLIHRLIRKTFNLHYQLFHFSFEDPIAIRYFIVPVDEYNPFHQKCVHDASDSAESLNFKIRTANLKLNNYKLSL